MKERNESQYAIAIASADVRYAPEANRNVNCLDRSHLLRNLAVYTSVRLRYLSGHDLLGTLFAETGLVLIRLEAILFRFPHLSRSRLLVPPTGSKP